MPVSVRQWVNTERDSACRFGVGAGVCVCVCVCVCEETSYAKSGHWLCVKFSVNVMSMSDNCSLWSVMPFIMDHSL